MTGGRDTERVLEALGARIVRSAEFASWSIVVDQPACARLASFDSLTIAEALETLPASPGVASLSGRLDRIGLEAALPAAVLVAGQDLQLGGGGDAPPQLPGTARLLARRLGRTRSLAFWLDPAPWSARRAHRAGLVERIARDPVRSARALHDSWAGSAVAAGLLAELDRTVSGRRGRGALERALFALAFSDGSPSATIERFLRRKRGGRAPLEF